MRRLFLLASLVTMSMTLSSHIPALADDDDTKTPDVVYVATPRDVVSKMLSLVNVGKDDVIYDLGCGDGRIVVTAAKRYGCRGVGVDINPVRVRESRENAKRNGVEELVKIEQKDIFTIDLSEASVLALYLLPSLNKRLIPQIQKLKAGSRIVTHDFHIPGATPEKRIEMNSREDGVEHYIYVYSVPLKLEPNAEDDDKDDDKDKDDDGNDDDDR